MKNSSKFIFPIFFFIFGSITACCEINKNSKNNYSEQFYGNGTVNDPYLIYNKADFIAIDGGDETINKYYRLEVDLLEGDTITEPLGDEENSFLGYFDGNGHSINLNIQGNYKDAGLFAHIGSSFLYAKGQQYGSVRNLKLTGLIDVKGDDVRRVGSLAAVVAYPGSSISNIASSVKVVVEGSNVSAVGGVVGVLYQAVVEYCYSTGDVIASKNSQIPVFCVGGISGSGLESTVEFCWSSSTLLSVKYINNSTGGILGAPAENINYCVALNKKISGAPAHHEWGFWGTYRITGETSYSNYEFHLTGNHAINSMVVDNGMDWGADVEFHDSGNVGENKKHGASVSLDEVEALDGIWWKTVACWSSYFGNDENAPWKWDNDIKRPVLWFE
jgi:hypothetical protein